MVWECPLGPPVTTATAPPRPSHLLQVLPQGGVGLPDRLHCSVVLLVDALQARSGAM